jgi:DNA replication protein DnaC
LEQPVDEKITFAEKLEYWSTFYADTLPQGFKDRKLSEAEGGEEIAILRAYDEGEDNFGFILMGEVGVGKTFILMALMNKVLDACYKYEAPFSDYVAYFPIGYLLFKLRNNRDPEEFTRCMKTKFLFLDDLGAENTTDFAREHFFTILDLRCQKKLPTFITTNLSFNELKEKYGERVVSRLKEMCIPIQIKGRDRRVDVMKDRAQKLKERTKLTIV